MMKVLVLGATGYIGSNVAHAFRRAGHEVWGLTIKPSDANDLWRNEIHPVVGNLAQPESYREVAEASDVLVQLAQSSGPDAAFLDRLTVQSLLDAARASGGPTTLIYTGGAWDYGNVVGRAVDETVPLHPLRATSWRPSVEKIVLDAQGVRPLVMRNGNVYGHGEKITAEWFAAAVGRGPLRVVGNGYNHWPMVHVDDVAEGYLRAAESGLSREVFNLTDGTSPMVREMVQAIARAADYRGEIQYVPVPEAEKSIGAMAEVYALDLVVDSSRAGRLLGWKPKHTGFLADVDTYFGAWKAVHGSLAEEAGAQKRAA